VQRVALRRARLEDTKQRARKAYDLRLVPLKYKFRSELLTSKQQKKNAIVG
jgi:hypothetical protein